MSIAEQNAKLNYAFTGYINGLEIVLDSGDTEHDIKIAKGFCRDSADSFNIFLPSLMVKKIDANWSEGNNEGGFPSGLTLSADTWYHFFVIAKSDGTVDAGFDTSLTAENLLADATGYTKYRRVGSVETDGSSNIKPFYQEGDSFYRPVVMDLYKTSDFSTSYASIGLSVPLGISVKPMIVTDISCVGIQSLTRTLFLSSEVFGFDLDMPVGDVVGGEKDRTGFEVSFIPTNTSGQIKYKTNSTADISSIAIKTCGWIDSRR